MICAEVNWNGWGAFLLGVGGIVTAYLAIRRAKMEGSQQCHELLNESRIESEGYARTLHTIRMEHPELVPTEMPEPKKRRRRGEEGLAEILLVLSLGMVAGSVLLAASAFDLFQGPPGQRGATGKPGVEGPAGPAGPAGPPGVGTPGPPGLPGIAGTRGATGSTGAPGVALVGPAGLDGKDGNPGAAGLPGAAGADSTVAGPQGGAGPPGQTGVQGPPGTPGVAGPPGIQGVQGPPGVQGVPGPTGPAGITVVSGNVGSDGAILSGTGFTVVRMGPGRYHITFAVAFPSPPTMTLGRIFGNPTIDAGTGVQPGETAVVDLLNATTAIVATGNANGTLTDGSFGFIAITVP